MKKRVEIYTDGSCLGNPGAGGYGVVLKYGKHCKTLSRGYKRTTNNRMELMAAIAGLSALKEPCQVSLYTDSQYLRQGMTEWIPKWEKNNWKNAKREPVKNADLWQRLMLLSQKHQVHWHWLKAHAGHPENEQCDALAKDAATYDADEDDLGFIA